MGIFSIINLIATLLILGIIIFVIWKIIKFFTKNSGAKERRREELHQAQLKSLKKKGSEYRFKRKDKIKSFKIKYRKN